MKKKVLALILAASMAISFTACGGSNSSSAGSDNTAAASEQDEAADSASSDSVSTDVGSEAAAEEIFLMSCSIWW